MLICHLMNGAVRTLNGELHQIFGIIFIAETITKSFVKYVDCCARGDFSRLRAAHTVGKPTSQVKMALSDASSFSRIRSASNPWYSLFTVVRLP